MRRFMRVITVRRHAVYAVAQDGEHGFFVVMRWDPAQLDKPRQVANFYPYVIGDEADKAKARAKAYAVALGMSEYARDGLDSERRDQITRVLDAAERECAVDYSALKAALRLEGDQRPLTPSEALEMDRVASEEANAMSAEEQESAKAEAITEEMSPAAMRRPAPPRQAVRRRP